MSKLLVRRDRLPLIPIEGEVVDQKGLPEFLKKSALGGDPEFFNLGYQYSNRELPIRNGENLFVLPHGYPSENGNIPAVWSGYRSCLTQDEETGQLYKLKGMAVGEKPIKQVHDDSVIVWGGQFLMCVNNEKKHCDRYNVLLRDNGIEPVMEHVGYYKLPFKVDRARLATSIMKVAGDTRLDELFYVFETISRVGLNGSAKKFEETSSFLYSSMGEITARMKLLMEKGRIVWSDSEDGPSNAHIGNIVVYQDEDRLRMGLVDFDATGDAQSIGQIGRMKQHKIEYKTLINSAFQTPISMRAIANFVPEEITSNFPDSNLYSSQKEWMNAMSRTQRLRTIFTESFRWQYAQGLKSGEEIDDSIDIGVIEELIEMLPEHIRQSFSSGLEKLINKDYDYYGAAGRHNSLNKKLYGLKDDISKYNLGLEDYGKKFSSIKSDLEDYEGGSYSGIRYGDEKKDFYDYKI